MLGTNQERETAGGGKQLGCGGQDFVEALDRAKGDLARGTGKGFGTGGEYIDARQCESADDFAEEGDLLLLGLDEGSAEARRPYLDGDAGESSARAEVEKIESAGRMER